MLFQTVYARTFDVVVFGGVYAGFAAACRLQQRVKSVPLIDRRATPLAESAWTMSLNVGRSDTPQRKAWIDALAQRSAGDDRFIDGAIAQVLANQVLLDSHIAVLSCATPVGVDVDDAGLSAVAVAVKEGVRVVRGRGFIDATPTGELVGLLASGFAPAPPTAAAR